MKISVIIPVFNAADYIEKCIQSVLNQTFSFWELILVDDGSTDESGEICDNYSRLDARIEVIHQQNLGPGLARNAGLEKACGDYIVFIDSDDYIDEDYFLLLSQHDEDVVFIDVDGISSKGDVVREEHLSVYSSLDKETFLKKQMTGYIPWGGVRKAVKRDVIIKNDIKYSTHKIGEEAIYSFLILYYARNFGFINRPVYYYLQRADSQSHTSSEDPWGKVAINFRNQLKVKNLYEKYAETVNAFIFAAAAGSSYHIASTYPYKEYIVRIKDRRKQLLDDLDLSKGIDYRSLSFKVILMGYLFKHRLYLISWILSTLKKNN